jgi:hypothetical protein
LSVRSEREANIQALLRQMRCVLEGTVGLVKNRSEINSEDPPEGLRNKLDEFDALRTRLPYEWYDVDRLKYDAWKLTHSDGNNLFFIPRGTRQANLIRSSTDARMRSKLSALPSGSLEYQAPAQLALLATIPIDNMCWRESIEGLIKAVDELLDEYFPGSLGDSDFKHSPDYATVVIHGQRLELTPQQRAIVTLLHENWKNGTPSVSKDYIISELKADESKYDSFQKLFRDDEAFRALIRKGQRKDTYRLNLPDKQDLPQDPEISE